MRFAYYLPRLAYNEATESKLIELGLGDRFRDCFGRLSGHLIVRNQIHAKGPDGSSGAWVYPFGGEQSLPLLWKPSAWEFTESDNGKFFVCWRRDDDREPMGLLRRRTITGQDVELRDGKVWHCPTIRRRLAIPNLPCSFQRKNGQVSKRILPEYRQIWDASGSWLAAVTGDGLSDARLFDIASTCLALNYRVGDEELRILDLLDDAAMQRVLEVAIDLDDVRRMLAEMNGEEIDDGDGSGGVKVHAEDIEFVAEPTEGILAEIDGV